MSSSSRVPSDYILTHLDQFDSLKKINQEDLHLQLEEHIHQLPDHERTQPAPLSLVVYTLKTLVGPQLFKPREAIDLLALVELHRRNARTQLCQLLELDERMRSEGYHPDDCLSKFERTSLVSLYDQHVDHEGTDDLRNTYFELTQDFSQLSMFKAWTTFDLREVNILMCDYLGGKGRPGRMPLFHCLDTLDTLDVDNNIDSTLQINEAKKLKNTLYLCQRFLQKSNPLEMRLKHELGIKDDNTWTYPEFVDKYLQSLPSDVLPARLAEQHLQARLAPYLKQTLALSHALEALR